MGLRGGLLVSYRGRARLKNPICDRLNATHAMSRLQDLPSELRANIILFVDWHCLWASDEKWADLLALRAASKPCKEAVRLSTNDHRACASIGFGGTNTRAIAAVGRVFGRGCAKLSYYGNHNHSAFPIDVVNPLRDFVVLETHGRLRALEINHSAITAPALEAMCWISRRSLRATSCASPAAAPA